MRKGSTRLTTVILPLPTLLSFRVPYSYPSQPPCTWATWPTSPQVRRIYLNGPGSIQEDISRKSRGRILTSVIVVSSPALSPHRGTDRRALLEVRERQASDHGSGPQQQDAVRILLCRVSLFKVNQPVQQVRNIRADPVSSILQVLLSCRRPRRATVYLADQARRADNPG